MISIDSSPAGGPFSETDWSMVKAGGAGDVGAREELWRRYKNPVMAYAWRAWELRRAAFPNAEGLLDGEELGNAFLSTVFQTPEFLRGADREKGRFRNYVLGALQKYVIDQGRYWKRGIRGGALRRVGDEVLAECADAADGLSPETACDQQMLLDALAWAAVKVRADWEEQGAGRLADELLGVAMREVKPEAGLRAHELAQRLGISARMVPHHKESLRKAHAVAVKQYLCDTCGLEHGLRIFSGIKEAHEAFRAFLKRRAEAARLKKMTRKTERFVEDNPDAPQP